MNDEPTKNVGGTKCEMEAAKRARGRPATTGVYTGEIRDAVIEAMERVGDGKGTPGLVAYLENMAKERPNTFDAFVLRMMPKEIKVDNHHTKHSATTVLVELRQALTAPLDASPVQVAVEDRQALPVIGAHDQRLAQPVDIIKQRQERQ